MNTLKLKNEFQGRTIWAQTDTHEVTYNIKFPYSNNQPTSQNGEKETHEK